MDIICHKSVLFRAEAPTAFEMNQKVADILNLSIADFYLTQNGKKLCSNDTLSPAHDVQVVLRILGGKGGFGSMLRAIGAQIEKTTNREACRDLSGRRLRDINEEQRLKSWIATQAERDKEAAERKKKKLEKLCQEPKHEFNDDTYYKERTELPERVENAVLQGLQASCSSSSNKRPAEDNKKKNKKRKLWLDADLDVDSSDEEEEESDNESGIKTSEIIKSSDIIQSVNVGKTSNATLE